MITIYYLIDYSDKTIVIGKGRIVKRQGKNIILDTNNKQLIHPLTYPKIPIEGNSYNYVYKHYKGYVNIFYSVDTLKSIEYKYYRDIIETNEDTYNHHLDEMRELEEELKYLDEKIKTILEYK